MAALQTREQSEHPSALGEALALVTARVRNQHWWHGSVRGLSTALAVDIALAALSRAEVIPGGFPLFLLLVTVGLAGISLGGWLAFRSPFTPMDAARLAEARLPLKERLSSALEFDESSRPNPLFALQHADAEAHARALDTRLAVPRRVPREAWLILPLLIALVLMLRLPSLPFGPSLARRAERETVRLAGRQLAQAAHAAAQQADARHQEGAKRQAQKMEALGKRMAQGHMDREQALAAVSEQEQQLAESGGAAPPSSSSPGQAAKDLAGANRSLPLSEPQSPASSKGASAPGTLPRSAGASAGQGGAKTSTQAAKQGTSRTAQGKPSGPAAHPAAPPKAATAGGGAGSPPAQQGQREAASPQPSSCPSSDPSKTSRAAEAASRQSQSPPSSSGAPEARQALENAHRQLAAPDSSGEQPPAKPDAPNNPTSSPAQPKPGSAARPNGAGKPGGQGNRVGGKPNGAGKPAAGRTGGQSEAGGGKPNGPPSPAGKGQDGQSGQGKPASQSAGNPGGAPGQPSPGGGAGQGAKFPFHAVLPPNASSKGQSISLGTPGRDGQPGKTLPRQSGRPAVPGGASRVPYSQALPRYRKSAESALDQEQVPPSQRAIVRDYFNSLQPTR